MKPWKDMSPEEKGALLLAHHEGKTIQCCDPLNKADAWGNISKPHWASNYAYRVKPFPVIKKVEMIGGYDHRDSWGFDEGQINPITHKITFNTIDGEPDCSSIKMEKLK